MWHLFCLFLCCNSFLHGKLPVCVTVSTVAEDESSVSEWCGWLRLNSSPESRVLMLWNKTAKARLSYIHTDKPTINDVITQWPRYADDEGHALVR